MGPGAFWGVEAWHYTRDYDFSAVNCTKYIFEWGECCRNSSILNIAANSSVSVRTDTLNLSLGCNNSPQWRTHPPFVARNSYTNYYDLGASDADGDSLVYSLAQVNQQFNTPTPYLPGYTVAQPFGPSWSINLDSETGLLEIIPQPGNVLATAIAIDCEEYRNGVKIGTTRLDFQITVGSFGPWVNQMPIIGNPSNFQNCAMINSEIVVAAGTTGSFDIDATDPDLDACYLSWLPTLPNVTVTDTFGVGPDSVLALHPFIRVSIAAPASFGTDNLTITAIDTFTQTNNMSVSPLVIRYGSPGLVWPGDTDNDLIANAFDLLPIGLAFGDTGPLRTGGTNAWIGQACTPWQDTITGGIDKKFADSNGDGTVNADDTLAITLNYGMVHTKARNPVARGATVDPVLTMTLPTSANVGDTIEVPILLGDMAVPANNVYGYAFTIQYNSAVIDSTTFYIEWDNSWLGNTSNSLDLYNNDTLGAFCDAGQVRKDHQPVSGYGEVARAHFVIIDNIDGRMMALDSADLELQFTAVKVIGDLGDEIPVDASGDTMTVYMVGGINPTHPLSNIHIGPNPAHDLLSIFAKAQFIQSVELIDIQGRSMQTWNPNSADRFNFNVGSFSKGIYFVKVQTEQETIVRKVVIE